MRVLACRACNTAYQIGGDIKEVVYLVGSQESFPCITPLCAGRLTKSSVWNPDQPITEIPVHAFFRAIHGFGIGKGAAASLADAKNLLLTKKIVEVHGEEVGQPERVILRQLVLEDGTRLHFDTSSLGACLYYIETSGPSCVEEFENGERNTTGSSTGGCPVENREEAGRVTAVDANQPESNTGVFASVSSALEYEEPNLCSVSKACGLPRSREPGTSTSGRQSNCESVRL
jgi:hypothetical protein